MSASFDRVRAIVEKASELHECERADYLDEACDGDATTRSEAEALLGGGLKESATSPRREASTRRRP